MRRRQRIVAFILAATFVVLYFQTSQVNDECSYPSCERFQQEHVLKENKSLYVPSLQARLVPFKSVPNLRYAASSSAMPLQRLSNRKTTQVPKRSGATSSSKSSRQKPPRPAVPPPALPPPALQPCDADCVRFQRYVQAWKRDPQRANQPVAAIYILTSTRSYITRCLRSVDKYFNQQFNYPVIVFHERAFRPQIGALRNSTTSDVFFQEVQFSVPKFLDAENIVENIACSSKISYRHMCRFQSKLIYEQPIMQELEYHWRLDDDSLLLQPVKYDVFQFMKQHRYVYGYVWKWWDSNDCTKGLWEGTKRYITQNAIKPTYFDEWEAPRMFYNNFEISALSLWLSAEYRAFIDYIDQLGGIYYYRWGDAPIKGLALSLFVEWQQVHYFEDIGYQHGAFVLNGSIRAQ